MLDSLLEYSSWNLDFEVLIEDVCFTLYIQIYMFKIEYVICIEGKEYHDGEHSTKFSTAL